MSSNNNKNKPHYKVDYGMDYLGDCTPQPQDEFVSRMWEATAATVAAKRGIDVGRPVVHTMDNGGRLFLPSKEEPLHKGSKNVSPSQVAMDFELPVESDKFVKEMQDMGVEIHYVDEEDIASMKGHGVSKEAPPPVMCPHCDHAPCYLEETEGYIDLVDSSGGERDLYKYLMDSGDAMEAEGFQNNQIRHALYKIATRFIHGPLPKGYRIEPPTCVKGEIRDSYPAKGGNYTGFKKGFFN